MGRSGSGAHTIGGGPKSGLWLAAIAGVTLLVLPALLFAASLSMKDQFDREHVIRAELQSAYDYRSLMRSVLIDLQDAETGQRGYLLTGKEAYLGPYTLAQNRVDGDLRQLYQPGPLTDPVALAKLSELSRLKFTELAETISLSRRGLHDKALKVVRSDRGQHYMDRARGLVAAQRASSAVLMSRWTRLADDSARTTERSAVAVECLMVMTLMASAGLLSQIFLQRRRTITKLAVANDEVSALLKTFSIAERVSNSGHWSRGGNGDRYWSAGAFYVFGLPVDTHPPSFDQIIGCYAEHDRPILREHLLRAMETQTGFAMESEIEDFQGVRKNVCLEAEYVHEVRGGALVGVIHDITASRNAQRALSESEERYRHLADSSTDIMATMALDSTIKFVSPACRRILGYSPEDLIGRKTLSITHPDDTPDVLAVFEGLRAAGPGDTTFAYRFRGRHKDGEWVWLEGQPRVEFDASGKPIRYQDVVREVGSRKAAEDALQASRALAVESERRYRLLAENATDIIAQYKLDGTLTYISPACENVLGYVVDDLVGRSMLDFIHPDDCLSLLAKLSAHTNMRRPEEFHTEHRVIRRDGTVIWLEGRPRLMFDDNCLPTEYHDVMRDVTNRKVMEAELREARTAAEAAARSKADFLANMSHELRTPLNSIVGFSSLIAEAGELEAETRHRAGIVKDSSRALVAIVDDILDFSKFEADGVKLSPEPTRLSNLLSSTVELMQQQADVRGVQLDLSLVEDVGEVLLDPARIRQVVLNLIGNAIKFTEHGTVSLALTQGSDHRLTISVQDTGIGIAEDRLGRIFDRFAQADASTSRRFGGTGLGLAICNSIVKSMGGELNVTSIVGEGSRFQFTIDPPRLKRKTSRQETKTVTLSSSVSGLRVLLADDNIFNQDLFGSLMQGRGLEITFVSNGREAVEATQVATFDLILMDMQMPVMDGIDATLAIRRAGLTQLPIVALTANVVSSQIDLCLAAGMDDHLAKPYTSEAVLAVMAKWTTEVRPCPCPARSSNASFGT